MQGWLPAFAVADMTSSCSSLCLAFIFSKAAFWLPFFSPPFYWPRSSDRDTKMTGIMPASTMIIAATEASSTLAREACS